MGATIEFPSNQRHFTSSPITMTGTCPSDTIVEIFKNNIFAGSVPCDSSGHYSVKVDLLTGRNILVAKVFDVLNQSGPDSNNVIVFYDSNFAQGAALTPLNFDGTQLLLNTDAVYRGIFPKQELSMPINIIGGKPPYAINILWGDLNNKVVPRNNNLTFNVNHAYDRPGTYQISVQATDSKSRVAFLTVAAIVNGHTGTSVVSNISKKPLNKLLVLWPFYITAVALVMSFWLGERREKHILGSNPITQHHSI